MIPPLRSFLASDRAIREVLRETRVIALVGAARAEGEHGDPGTGRMLRQHGYRVLEVAAADPSALDALAPGEAVDALVLATPVADVPAWIEAAERRGVRTLWFQPGTGTAELAHRAHRGGATVVLHRDIVREYASQFPEDELP